MEELPEGWAQATLGEVSRLVSGAGFPLHLQGRAGLPLPYFKVGNLGEVGSGELLARTVHSIDEATARALRAEVIPAGAVVFAKIGMAIRLNRRRQLAKPSCIDNNMMAAVPGEAVIPGFLLRYLETVDLLPLSQSTTVPSVRKSDLEKLLFPLPPSAEQKRIVEKVEALLAQVQAARDRLERVQQILKRFRQAVLAAAFHGRLTADWREINEGLGSGQELLGALRRAHEQFPSRGRSNAAEPSDEAHDLDSGDLPASWAVAEMEWLCEPGRPITYGILKPGPDTPGGVPYVRVADYPGNRLRLDGIKRTTKAIAAEYRRAELRTGDVLVAIRGTFGRVCRVPRELNGGNITQDTARLTIDGRVSADYVLLYLQSSAVQKRLERAAKGAAVRGVNIGDVRALQVALPPREEQEAVVRRVLGLLALADAIEGRVASTLARAAATPRAILAKAFAGELVASEAELAAAEGRGFESGEELLGRLRVERLVNDSGKRTVGRREAGRSKGSD